jgi:hypothetical protein
VLPWVKLPRPAAVVVSLAIATLTAPLLMSQPEYTAFMQAEIVKWAKVIEANHIAFE